MSHSCDPMDYTVHGILQTRILELSIAFPFSSWSSQPRNWTTVSCIAGGFFTVWATWMALDDASQTLCRGMGFPSLPHHPPTGVCFQQSRHDQGGRGRLAEEGHSSSYSQIGFFAALSLIRFFWYFVLMVKSDGYESLPIINKKSFVCSKWFGRSNQDMVSKHFWALVFPLERKILIYSSFIKRLPIARLISSIWFNRQFLSADCCPCSVRRWEMVVLRAECRFVLSISWLQPRG